MGLFTPYRVRSLTIPNRIVMAPMTREFSPGGTPTPEVAAYYRRRAEGETGLIITEGTAVNRPAAVNFPAIPNFHGSALEAWKTVFDAVHAAGGKIAPQLWHVGAVPHKLDHDWRPTPIDSPSGIYKSGRIRGEPMTDEAIADTIAAYARGAADARELGADAVELHGAHGYLIDQFLWEETNLRTDRWGGKTLAERVRYGVEVVRAVRSSLGSDIPLILRLSTWKVQDYDAKPYRTPEDLRSVVEPLTAAGVDVFHCSQRRFWEPLFNDGSDLNFAGWTKKISGVATITVGRVGLAPDPIRSGYPVDAKRSPMEELMRRFDRGDFDLVAVGRALLADPNWPRKVREGRAEECAPYHPSLEDTLY
jgi:2,4-dienoyl-CoA reductase-like NADH-dependent reductase (Old Yellow Enzyme family)